MSNYYRLVIRFTNGETQKFVVNEPIDGAQISDRTRYAIVRTRRLEGEPIDEVFVASFADMSYVKTQLIAEKDLRHRVAGLTGSVGFDEPSMDAFSTIQFV